MILKSKMVMLFLHIIYGLAILTLGTLTSISDFRIYSEALSEEDYKNIAVLMIIMLTLPTGLNSIVLPEAYGGDSYTGAQLCFVSVFTCLIFIPVILSFYQFLSKKSVLRYPLFLCLYCTF